MGQASTIGLDIAKRVFQAHGADATGRVVFRKRLVRAKVLEFFAGQPRCLVALEACGGGHPWGGRRGGGGIGRWRNLRLVRRAMTGADAPAEITPWKMIAPRRRPRPCSPERLGSTRSRRVSGSGYAGSSRRYSKRN